PFVQTWSFCVKRELRPGSVFEIRYVGNAGERLWHTYNVNEVNIFENGFLDQFKTAQNNLSINAANGMSNSFSDQTGVAGVTPTNPVCALKELLIDRKSTPSELQSRRDLV